MTLSNPLHTRVYDLLKSACESRTVSPTLMDIGRTLGVQNDPKGSKVKHAVDVVVRSGLLARAGKRGARTIYQIPGTDFRTLSPEEGFADTCGSALSAKRAAILYDFISIRCRRNGFTPSYVELAKRISETGRSASVGHLLGLLERQGKIAREGGNRKRIYRLPGTSFATRPAPLDERARFNPFSTAGWPRPTEASRRSYDLAVERREFALHNVPVEQDADRRFIPKPTVETRSWTGSSAEMCAI